MGFFLKIAKMTPLFKNADPENITNYRPISVLSCFSIIQIFIRRKIIIFKGVWIP